MRKNQRELIGVGFEPTPPKRLVPETSALDRSAIQPLLGPGRGGRDPQVERAPDENEKKKNNAPTVGLEPTTTRLRVLRSTN